MPVRACGFNSRPRYQHQSFSGVVRVRKRNRELEAQGHLGYPSSRLQELRASDQTLVTACQRCPTVLDATCTREPRIETSLHQASARLRDLLIVTPVPLVFAEQFGIRQDKLQRDSSDQARRGTVMTDVTVSRAL